LLRCGPLDQQFRANIREWLAANLNKLSRPFCRAA
jgi:hypothetical protein